MDDQEKKKILASTPRFCPIHLKIHVCEETQISNIVKVAEQDLGARVRRLHGIQTEEELQAEAEKAKKNADAKGSFGAILAAAKNKINEIKSTSKNNDIDKQTKAVSQNEVNDRMAALRSKMSGDIEQEAIIQEEKPSNVSKPKKTTTKSTNKEIKDSKRPEIYKEVLDVNDRDLDEMGSVSEALPEKKTINVPSSKNKTNSPTAKKSPTKKNNQEVVFTIEQTQELIQEAVKKALEEIGIVKKK